jgi:hypothetical protein
MRRLAVVLALAALSLIVVGGNVLAQESPAPSGPATAPSLVSEAATLVIQAGNSLPQTPLVTLDSAELADNRIGLYIHGMWGELWDPQDWLNREAFDLGVTRMRYAINELDVGMVDWTKSEFQITQKHNTFINGLADNGLISTYVLSFWDKAHHSAAWNPVTSRFKTEEEFQRYIEFVRFIVQNVRGRTQYFELWNEPDVGDLRQRIEVPEYIELVKRTRPVLDQEYPAAKIVISVSGTSSQPTRNYLFGLLNSDIMPLVDVVSWHAMYGTSPVYETDYYNNYATFVQQIKDTAHAHGFQGEFWATELLWRSPDCTWCNPGDPLYSNIVAAKYYARGVLMHLGMDVTTGVAGMSQYLSYAFPTLRNVCTVAAGAQPTNLPVVVGSAATNIKRFAFTLPGGDALVAVWRDSAAVDEDLGVQATLTITGYSAGIATVTGVDVQHGVEQELIRDDSGGNLVIRNLVVKDYPLLLRLLREKRSYLPAISRS